MPVEEGNDFLFLRCLEKRKADQKLHFGSLSSTHTHATHFIMMCNVDYSDFLVAAPNWFLKFGVGPELLQIIASNTANARVLCRQMV